MKCRSILAGLAALLSIHLSPAQEQAPACSSPESVPSEPISPRLVIPEEDVVSTKVQTLGERTVTIQRVQPIELPPIPEPPPIPPNDPGAQARRAEMQASNQDRPFIFVGATAHLFKDQPGKARSYVRFWTTPQSQPVAFWTNANFLWLTGFSEVEANGVHYQLMAAISQAEWTGHSAIATRSGKVQSPAMPEFADESEASLVVVEGQPTSEQLAPIQALLNYYNRNRERLKADFEQREIQAKAKAEERKANPPEKKNLVLRYWRMDQAGQAGETSHPAATR